MLSTKPSVLSTIEELSNSDLRFGIEEQPYTITYIVKEAHDIYIQKLNRSKIYENGKPNFVSPADGIKLVKTGGYAYHTDESSAYNFIAEYFNQNEICDLNEIDFLLPAELALMLPKVSPYTKLFMIR